jgi:AsmA protein
MRRALWILATAGLFAAALFALLILLLPRETLRTRIGEQIAAWTGRDVSLSGEPEIDIFPRLSVTLNDVAIAGPPGMDDAEVLSMERLTGRIRILPLIIGEVEFKSFTMLRPVIRLVRDAEGRRNWEFDSGAAALQLAFAGDVPLGEFLLQDGTLVYEDRDTGETERLDSVDLTVDWQSVRTPLSISGSGIWRGEQINLSASAEAPFQFMSGDQSPTELHIEAQPIAIAFEGAADSYPATRLAGPLRLSTPSLRRLSSWLGNSVRPGSTLGAASVVGTATFHQRMLSVESAELTLDGNNASGALNVTATKGKPQISGTLASPRLDLTPYFAGLLEAFRTTENWQEIELDTDWFRDLAADIRLSASAVQIGTLRAGATAATVSLREGRLEVGLARAILNDGNLAGDLAITDRSRSSDTDFEAQFHAVDIGLDEVAPLFAAPAGIRGTASGTVDVVSRGDSLGGVVAMLAGSARLDVRDGALPLFGIAELASAQTVAQQSAPTAQTTTPLNSFSAAMSFAENSGVLDRASMVTPTFSANATGLVGFVDGSLSLSGTMRRGAPGQIGTGSELPFRIEGTLRRPVAVPLALN